MLWRIRRAGTKPLWGWMDGEGEGLVRVGGETRVHARPAVKCGQALNWSLLTNQHFPLNL